MLVKSQVKYIQSLSQKKSRDEEGVFIAEGPKIINELLRAQNITAKQLYAVKGWMPADAEWQAVPVVEVSEQELERLSALPAPNQVVGIFEKPVFSQNTDLRGRVTLMLDTIQDPGNMGTILRCADWFGIETVVCSKDCVDVFNSKVVQSTMGSISRVRVLYEDLFPFLEARKDIPVFAATLGGMPLNTMPAITEGILVIGNESKGISEDMQKLCKHHITIPRKGQAESLNAAVATGIILSHLIR
jgi:TrmH family RNA methyltransferase